ncbi:MAG: phoD [Myxococcaceae bacterium]|nr:phoD [Myxococcaceae bacterium]
MITRRELLAGMGASVALGAGCGDGPDAPPDAAADAGFDDDVPADADAGAFTEAVDFLHGVASGDPLADRVILWTRVTPRGGARGQVAVRWELSASLDFAAILAQGELVTSAARDFTVKVDAAGLPAGATLYYRFAVGAVRSPVGRTRTTPTGAVERVRLAVVSCASLAHGYFHVYREIAERLDLDAVVHLGDYIYEYPSGFYGDVRPYDPPTEIVSLTDYRRRHGWYKRDPDLRAMHQQHPMIAVWDDHEFANNAWEGGAEAHMPRTEGEWRDRKAAAMRAYFEWMPLREQPDGRIWRRFAFGDLVDLVMLDTRIWARPQPLPGNSPMLDDPHRNLLGDAQEQWFFQAVTTSSARWKVVGQQVRMAHLQPKFNADTWEGFPASRSRFFDVLARMRADDVVVLTGDIHTCWAMDLTPDPFDRDAYDPRTGRGSLGVELIVSGVTSPGHPPEVEAEIPGLIRQNPHMRYGNASQRGYILLDCDAQRAQGEWFLLPHGSVEQRERRRAAFNAGWLTRRGDNHLTQAGNPSLPREGAAPPAPWEPA